MIRIGRYGIGFGRNDFRRVAANWIPHPFRSWHFLCFWFLKEARSTDDDKKPHYPLGTEMLENGRRYRYWHMVKNPVSCGDKK